MESLAKILPGMFNQSSILDQQTTQTLIECTQCHRQVSSVKDKEVGGYEYKGICIDCWVELKRVYNEIDTDRRNKSFSIKEKLNKRNERLEKIPIRYKDSSFNNFSGEMFGINKIHHDFTDNIFIWNNKAGCGKTHLAYALYKKVVWHFRSSLFITAPELLLEIRSCFKDDSCQSEDRIIEKYTKCDILFIDDIGAEKVSDFSLQTWYLILDGRWSNIKPTVFTSNLSLKQIAECFGDRIASRIGSGRIFKIDGIDRRINK